LDFAEQNGGWRTYRDNDITPMMGSKVLECQGWTTTHVCVTAAAAYVLATGLNNQVLVKTLEHLVKVQQPAGHWQSYWWSNDVYATSFAMQALSKANTVSTSIIDKNNCIQRAGEWLADQQNSNGGWGDAFYTALAIKAFLCNAQRWKTPIEHGINWLLNNQLDDGSWLTTHVLRVPQPDVLSPNKITKWRKSPFGYNTLTIDDQRTFTTSLIVSTLQQFWLHKKETSC
jgi:sporulenol synthase